MRRIVRSSLCNRVAAKKKHNNNEEPEATVNLLRADSRGGSYTFRCERYASGLAVLIISFC